MPLATGTITGTFLQQDQTPHSGVVELIPSAPVVRDETGKVIVSGRLKVALDETGSFAAEVLAFDADSDPDHVTWTVVPKLTRGHLAATEDVRVNANQTVDLSQVISVDPVQPNYARVVGASELFESAKAAKDDAELAVEIARTAAQDVKDLILSDLGTTDGQTRALIEAPASQTAQALSATYEPKTGRVIVGGFDLVAIEEALDLADSLGAGTVVYFPPGTYDVGTGLSLADRSCQIHGSGAYMNTGLFYFGTVFHATTQTGPVLNFDGWNPPASFTGKVVHQGFQVLGSGAPDATKNNAGIHVAILGSTTFRDIAISETGGPCIKGSPNPGDAQYLSNFENITLNTPVEAGANDVPWIDLDEANCCLFSHIGLRHIGPAVGSVGLSGAVRIRSNGTYASGGTVFRDCWMENLHVPSLGTLVNIQGNQHEHHSWRFVDCYKETADAVETSFYRLTEPPVGSQGSNVITGVIPGHNPDIPTWMDMGVDVRQSFNTIQGSKGYKGGNVVIRGSATPGPVGPLPDVIHTTAILTGGDLFIAEAGVIDQAPSATGIYQNRWIDFSIGQIKGFTVTP